MSSPSSRYLLILGLLLPACGRDKDSGSPPDTVLAACGNGVTEPDEQCDDGDANSDTAPDACRTSCRLPTCGDAISDAGEDCDDGNAWGGDGCAPGCIAEPGPLEAEPNDTWDTAQAAALGMDVYGALPEGDQDCFSLSVPRCHAVRATLGGDCAAPAILRLYAPDGTQVAAGGGDCPVLEPADEPGARFLSEGTWAVCAAPLLEAALPAYTLWVETLDSGTLGLELGTLQDLDRDGYLNDCDDDIDGDGYLNEDDNCPEVSNGADALPLSPDSDGFLRHWLLAGPFFGASSPQGCLPTALNLIGEDDAAVSPVVGDPAGDLAWRVHTSPGSRLDMEGYASAGAPREIYVVTYFYNPEARDMVFGLGPDDGARVWLDGASILEVSGCQGTNVDQFKADVSLAEGWHQLTLKVYDQGGGWGTYARFRLADGTPVTDLEVSLTPGAAWVSDQSDMDGDGIGDVCDETPAGG